MRGRRKRKKIMRAPRKDIIDFRELKIIVSPIRVEGRDLGFISGLSDYTEVEMKLDFLSIVGTMIGFSFFILAREKADIKKVGNIIFRSKKMEEVIRLCLEVAKSDATVLIRGESGVGKELIADLIHENSYRGGKQIVKINCAAIPENLLESELFGYKKGAFTGAISDKKGKFELAEGGTIFLDEIGDLPPSLQAKLLRVIQTKEIEPIGGTTKKVNVRIIAATNRNLEELVREGKFREDLYYRLNVVPIFIPPLRERKEDIRPLVDFFLEKFNKKYGKNISISKGAMLIFEDYDWYGNVRELENLVERLVITSSDLVITPDDIPDYIRDYVMKKKKKRNRRDFCRIIQKCGRFSSWF
jgi:Transcriptional regulator containing GAF, AAA-type ATPase, and DNA binding domains